MCVPPFVIVPPAYLYKRPADYSSEREICDGGVFTANNIRRYKRLLGDRKKISPLRLARGRAQDVVNFLYGGGALGNEGKVGNGARNHGYTQGDRFEFPVQPRLRADHGISRSGVRRYNILRRCAAA